MKIRSSDEILDFIAAGKTPESIIAFRPTPSVTQRVKSLVEKKKEGFISSDEEAELDDFFQLEHLMILAKARARHYLEITR